MDWLDINLSAADSSALVANMSSISDAKDFVTIENLFAQHGIADLYQRLVERRIKGDFACQPQGLPTGQSYPDSLLLTPVKEGIIRYLQ